MKKTLEEFLRVLLLWKECKSIINRYKYGLLNESENKLDYVLGLTVHRFMDRRLQTLVYRKGLAKSIHHARVLIR